MPEGPSERFLTGLRAFAALDGKATRRYHVSFSIRSTSRGESHHDGFRIPQACLDDLKRGGEKGIGSDIGVIAVELKNGRYFDQIAAPARAASSSARIQGDSFCA